MLLYYGIKIDLLTHYNIWVDYYNMSEIPEDEINTESESDASIKQIEEKYYLKPSPSKQSSFYITKQQHNDGYERGQLQYKIEPKLLKKVITDNIENDVKFVYL